MPGKAHNMIRVSTGRELSRALKRVGSKATKKEMTLIIQKLSMTGFRELVMYSAADTGFLRSNWEATTAKPPNTILKDYEGGAWGDAKWPRIRIEAGDIVTLYNNTEYAMFLEKGTPNMRAQPMVGPTYYGMLTDANRLVRELSKRRSKG